MRTSKLVPLLFVATQATLAAPAAKPVPGKNAPHMLQIEFAGGPSELRGTYVGGPSGSQANQETIFFGGTYWNSDSSRWEAIKDSVWTFDSGVGTVFDSTYVDSNVDPFKDLTKRYAVMEGWYGDDRSRKENFDYWRAVGESDARWDSVCVGTHHGLQGSFSAWSGVFQDEALALSYEAGQGYGNNWRVAMRRLVPNVGGAGDGQVTFLYSIELESCCDFVEIYSDPTGDPNPINLNRVPQAQGGHLSGSGVGEMGTVDLLVANQNWPAVNNDAYIYFVVETDEGWSDEDLGGGFSTECGAFSLDSLVIIDNGTPVLTSDFETGTLEGWETSFDLPGMGDYSSLQTVSALGGFVGTDCDCNLQDNVVTFQNDLGVSPEYGTWNLVTSPWIDLKKHNAMAPRKFFTFDLYGHIPLHMPVTMFFDVEWYPAVGSDGKVGRSGWRDPNTIYYYGGLWGDLCSPDPNGPYYGRDYTHIIDPGAEQVRVAIGIYVADSGGGDGTPWIDNIRFGTQGDPDAPSLFIGGDSFPQDAFPQDGTLDIKSPGRFDGTFRQDTLTVSTYDYGGLGAGIGNEVSVNFAVDFGPGADTTGSSFLAGLTPVGTWQGQEWYSARMDTAEASGAVREDRWMTTFIEGHPRFVQSDTALDPNDLDHSGNPGRLLNDIFPDDLFTPGSRINYYFTSRRVDILTGLPVSSVEAVAPDTAGGNYLEWECLPSSMSADTSWNCVLFVEDTANIGGFPRQEGRGRVETALASVLQGVSENFEGTPWDRYEMGGYLPFARGSNSQSGCTLNQALGYKTIIWTAEEKGPLAAEDANLLKPWLQLHSGDLGNNQLYVSGNGDIANPTVLSFLNDICGVDFICSTVRESACNGLPNNEEAECIPVDPVGGSFLGSPGSGTVALYGNGCPERRRFNVLTPIGPTSQGNEQYVSPGNGGAAIPFHSITNSLSDGAAYKTVWEGGGVHLRTDAATCTDSQTYVTDRVQRILDWFGLSNGGNLGSCSEPAGVSDVPDLNGPDVFVTALRSARPNPFQGNGRVTIAFSTAARGDAKIEVFDINGRLVRTVENRVLEAGDHEITWDGLDDRGRSVASGVYFYRLSSRGETFAKKLVVIRNGG